MGRVARGAKSRWTRSVRLTLLIAVGVISLALPTTVAATAPAQGQYNTPQVGAGGSGHPGDPGGQVSPTSGGSGNAALPILLGGVAVIGGATGLILYRRRRGDSTPD